MHKKLFAVPRRFARPVAAALLAIACLLAFAGTAFGAPVITSPAPTPGATGLLPGVRPLAIQASDTVPLMRNSTLSIDGVVVPSTFYFAQLWEYDPEIDEDIMVGEDRMHGQLYANPYIGFGTHTATARVYNLSGQVTTYSWSFNVGGTDTIGPITPLDASYIANRSPLVSARVTSSSSATPTVRIDGALVTPTSYSGGVVRYQTSNLTNDAWHTALVTAPDGVTTARSEFKVHTGAPAFSAAKPTVTSVANPLISAKVSDTVPLATPGVGAVTLDGVIVPFTFTPLDVARLSAEVRVPTLGLANGVHTVSMTVANAAGTPTTKTWSFTVGVPATLSEFVPAPSTTAITTTPMLSVKVTDNSVGGVTGGFTIDGVALAGTYNAGSKTLSAAVPSALADGAHTVVVTVTDATSVTASATWTFRTSSTAVMPTPGSCDSCHPGYPTGHEAGRAACDVCHDDLGSAPVNWVPPTYPHVNRDCTWCHTYANNPPVPFHPVAHDTSQDMTACTGCHSAELTTEHYRRTDDNGDALTCATCHSSSDPIVSAAIAAGDTTCATCHPSGSSHAFAHESEVATLPLGTTGFTCADCHLTELTSEHLKPTSSSAVLSCSSCHPSPRNTLSPWDKTCAQGGCHVTGTPQEMHGNTTASHSVRPANAGCFATGCHQGTDLAAIHSEAATTVAGVPQTSCLVCHADGSPESGDCTTCHTADGVDYHTAKDAKHTSTSDGSCFGAGCHDDSKMLPEVHDTYVGAGAQFSEYDTSCELCHDNSNPNRIDWSVSQTAGCTDSCHGSPNHSDMAMKHAPTVASSGCTSADCHGSDLTGIHGADTDDSRCAVCHEDPTNWTKTADCVSCHDTGAPHGDVEAVHAVLPENAACAVAGCHPQTTLTVIHSEATTTVAGVTSTSCRVCHPAGGPAPASKDCVTCHPEMSVSHYNPVTHGAVPGSGSYAINGATYGPLVCTECHGTDLGAEHDKAWSSTAGDGCSTCHPSPRNTVGTWGKTCAEGGCHTVASADPQHSTIDAAHALPVATPSCLAAGCHTGGDLAALHSAASTATPSGTRTSCLVCHTADAAPQGECASCHDMNNPHPDMTGTHDATDFTGEVAVFDPAVSEHDYTTWYGACTECHASSNLMVVHNNNCSACHATGGPVESLTSSIYVESGALVDAGFENGTDGASLDASWTVVGSPQTTEYDSAHVKVGNMAGHIYGPTGAAYGGVSESGSTGMATNGAEIRFWAYFDTTNQFRTLDDFGTTAERVYSLQFGTDGSVNVFTNRVGNPNGYTTNSYTSVGTYSTGWTQYRIVHDFASQTYTLWQRAELGGTWTQLSKAGSVDKRIPFRGVNTITQSHGALFRTYQNANLWLDDMRFDAAGITESAVIVPGGWNGSCQQGDCHVTKHDAAQAGHTQQLLAACENCHQSDFSVDCQSCH